MNLAVTATSATQYRKSLILQGLLWVAVPKITATRTATQSQSSATRQGILSDHSERRWIMTNKDIAIQALCEKLGKEYSVTTIDFERVIYRDFGNGFNVEISGMHTTSKRRKAILYLWYGNRAPNCTIVKTVKNVDRADISAVTEELLSYSNALIAQGYDTHSKDFA